MYVALSSLNGIFLWDCADQPPKHINFGQHVASNVPSLKDFREQSTNLRNGISTLKALSSAMLSLQRCFSIVTLN